MIITETAQCKNSPANGALNGLFDAKNDENGRTPSRPSSCTTAHHQISKVKKRDMKGKKDGLRPWLNMTDMIFPSALSATNTLRARSALGPNMLRKNRALSSS